MVESFVENIADEDLLDWHRKQITAAQKDGKLFWEHYRGEAEPDLARILSPGNRLSDVIVNMCRKFINAKNDRMQIRALIIPDGTDEDQQTMEGIRRRSLLDAEFGMFNIDRLVPGYGYLSVDQVNDLPRISARSPENTSVLIDEWTGEVESGAVIWKPAKRPGGQEKVATECAILYGRNTTQNFEKVDGKWAPLGNPFHHNLGVVPLVAHFNRRQSGTYQGVSELVDLIPIVNQMSETLTNMSAVLRAHGGPWKFITGLEEKDLLDKDGNLRSRIEMYTDQLTLLGEAQAKVGQLPASSIENFGEAMRVLTEVASGITGLPARDLGLSTSNPPSEGSIIADEIAIVRDIESDCVQVGVSVSQAASIAYQMETGKQLEVPVRVEWQNPATPTIAQRTDALVKLKSAAAMSNETIWEEMGKDEAWKAREKQRLAVERDEQLAAEAAAKHDPAIDLFTQSVIGLGARPGDDTPLLAGELI